jgi:ribosomal subunit interface protein
MEIIFKGRQTDVPARFREYATTKLNKLVRLEKKAISVDVEVSVERNPRLSSMKERVELTIWSGGPAIRAEAAAEDRLAALDLALAKLDSRLRRALDRRKNHHGAGVGAVTGASAGSTTPPGPEPGGEAAASVPAARTSADGSPQSDGYSSDSASGDAVSGGAAPESDRAAAGESVVPIQMEGDGPLVIRQKFHQAKPISIDQALLEMELVGHDFYLFHDVDANMPSVVYRRHGYQYGVIRLVDSADGLAAPEQAAPGDGAKIPARRRGARTSGSQAAMAP